MICILKFAKGLYKVLVELWYLVCPHRLIMLYIGTGQPRQLVLVTFRGEYGRVYRHSCKKLCLKALTMP